jgi:transposase-like protein
MNRRPRRNHSPAFKAKVAFAAIKGDKTLAELSSQFDLHQNQIIDWKNQLLANAGAVFGAAGKVGPEIDLEALHAKIGQQALEIDFLAGALNKAGLLSVK